MEHVPAPQEFSQSRHSYSLVSCVAWAQGTSDVNAPSRVASFQQTNVPPEVRRAEVTSKPPRSASGWASTLV